jgi:putative lumazine-binding protein
MSSLLSLGLPAVLAAAAPASSADRTAIEETVRHYFRSGDENDAAELETAFHPTLGMYWVGKDGNVQALARHAWAERLRSATARQPATVRHIVSLDIAGNVAVAKLHSEFRTHQFDDLVTLLRMGGRWRIVLKVFHRREPADAPLPTAAQVEAERQAIRGVLGQVLQAMDSADGAGLGAVALERGQTYSLDRGELVAVSIPEWQARLDQARAQGKATPARREVDWVEVADDVAVARVTHRVGEETTVGFGSLLRTGAGWKLVGVVHGRP